MYNLCVSKKNNSAEAYIANLPEDRKSMMQAVYEVIEKNIDPKFEQGMQYGLPAWFLPHSEYPDGYHCDPKQPLPFAGIGNQKNHIGIYLFGVYCDPKESEKFAKEWKSAGKKLDMGKSCIRVKTLKDIPLEVISKLFQRMTASRFVKSYEAGLSESARKKISRLRDKRE